jgi:dephospho-CoA kinase
VAPGTKSLARIVQNFGREILRDDGTLDRPALGRIIFNNGDARKQLNAIVHPAVRYAMFWAVMRHWWAGERICVVDVPLLIESKLYPYVGRVVVVYW